MTAKRRQAHCFRFTIYLIFVYSLLNGTGSKSDIGHVKVNRTSVRIGLFSGTPLISRTGGGVVATATCSVSLDYIECVYARVSIVSVGGRV